MQELDFVRILTKIDKTGIHITPKFVVKKSKDLMVRGRAFYAVWDEAKQLWSRDPFDVIRIVDEQLREKLDTFPKESEVKVSYLSNQDVWNEWVNYINRVPDNYQQLDSKVIFADTKIKREDFASKRLSYSLCDQDIPSYENLIGTLYDPLEKQKLEWAIGSILAGRSKDIQKFIVIYGEPGSGKSTIIHVIQELFDGYYTVFDAKAIGSFKNSFSLEPFKEDPLVALQHDGDLSQIEDNTVLNSVTSHEMMLINEKFKATYRSTINSFLFMGTNKPVKITDAKSGIIRRLIDVYPSGKTVSHDDYNKYMNQIKFELGGIAKHCLSVFNELGENYYDEYRAINMIGDTNDFYNFVVDCSESLMSNEGITLRGAWDLYKDYCEDAKVPYPFSKRRFKVELKNYFESFSEKTHIDGKQVRNYYKGFLVNKFYYDGKNDEETSSEAEIIGETKELNSTDDAKESEKLDSDSKKLVLGDPDTIVDANEMLADDESIFDREYSDQPAQYATKDGYPSQKWDNVTTTLKDIDTKRLHYVRVPENLIVIDFDIHGDDGSKDLDKNIEASQAWPKTYSELSKSGSGVHLHYIYDGDPTELSRVYDDNIEIKVFTGNSALRRKLTVFNNVPIAHISSGLPKRGVKVVSSGTISNEKALRGLIRRNLAKEIHPGTKPSIDFIKHILDEAYANKELHYDVTDLRPAILAFANNSTNHSDYCVKLVTEMHFQSDDAGSYSEPTDDELVFFDVEVFPNLFVIVWKGEGKECVKMINPTPIEVEDLVNHRLVGFNNRRYDNHILYARIMGYNNEQLYNLSTRIIGGSKNSSFVEAYNLSYADVLDFSSKKQSLKKFEIELGLHHQELDLPWDKPVPEDMWKTVADYCVNDVVATEATFKARHEDFVARQLLAAISGLSVNDTNRQHTEKILFGNDRHPQTKFIYTDLSTIFPGYKYENGKSSYRGENPGEGGYVYSEPGIYHNVALLDIASMHPHSLIALNLFGDEYTKNYEDLVNARIFIKHGEFDAARSMLGGKLAPYLTHEDQAKALSKALKIPINSVYGLTSAKFDNKFKDPRNVDNIVAKRGALFMIDLKHAVQERGFTVAHIKTDSIKIPDATPEIIEFVCEMGKKFGYTFEHEATYEKMCLVNDAVYIAKESFGDEVGKWTATGAQFAEPYVFKTLFSHEPIVDKDFCETKAVTGDSCLYLDMNEGLNDVSTYETEMAKRKYNAKTTGKLRKLNADLSGYSDSELSEMIANGHSYSFVGKAGSFVPISSGKGGGILYREKDDDSGNPKYYAAAGTKGYRWLESEVVRLQDRFGDVDKSYFTSLVDEAVEDISKYGDIEAFLCDSEKE
jgi:energy-coupling factor transporter ATP-binding protein EcfA2